MWSLKGCHFSDVVDQVPIITVCSSPFYKGFLSGSEIKNPSAKQEMWVRSQGLNDPLKKEMATHSYILAWEIPWTEEPGGLHSMGSQKELDMPQ